MAFYERGDEANSLVKCPICVCGVKENGLTKHINGCIRAHPSRFDEVKGDLIQCQFNANHIVKTSERDEHNEYCDGFQKKLLEEFQTQYEHFLDKEYNTSDSGSDDNNDDDDDDDDVSKADSIK